MDHRLSALKKCIHKLQQVDKYILRLQYEKELTLENIWSHISKSTRATYYSLVRIYRLLIQRIKRTLIEHSPISIRHLSTSTPAWFSVLEWFFMAVSKQYAWIAVSRFEKKLPRLYPT